MKQKSNETNERVKRAYGIWKREARRASHATVDKALEAVSRFEAFTKNKDFKSFKVEQAIEFKRDLEGKVNRRTGAPLAKATIDGTLRCVKDFFDWLADQPGYRSRIKRRDLEYFNLNAKDARVAHTHREVDAPTIEQCAHAFSMMPTATVFDRCQRAMFAVLMLTAARDGAMVSIRLKHIDLVDNCLNQDAREMATKASKTFTTWFFPVDGVYRETLENWVNELRSVHLFGPTDPVFPKARMGQIDGQFAAVGLAREPYAGATKVRGVVATAFLNVGLPKFQPHSFRRTLVSLGNDVCKTPEQFKAWSMNLGHDSVVTTMQAYCRVPPSRQRELIKGMNA